MKNLNVNLLKALLLAAIGVVSLSLSGMASAVSCGDTITTPSTLTAALSCTENPAVTVEGAGSLDLNGYSITCTNGSGIGIKVLGAGRIINDSVGGNFIKNCDTGVFVDGIGGHIIQNVNALENLTSGFALVSNGNLLESSTADSNDGIGVRMLGIGNQVRNSIITFNTLQGVRVAGNSSIVLLNDISLNDASGVVIADANSSLISSNTANDNGTNGILLQDFSQVGNVIVGNDATGNAGNDLVDQNLIPCITNIWVLNTFDDSNDACIN
ncbi:hypothetical protein BTJ40_21965 [Microbulbifer sp. A4B17]|uniref:right-handed parallel beta-helix repeat-containing protein n=1 Tax=Microbulbifer sp. A4B17 TaxID=359370 RepID=UPI000D52E64D|nr:right-handed parallel beta-helix repeat-containing protein [Microbulbifer sp. A4B17]AWF83267.1 hypothetical protein BTJ40_21965 [Microbulbifer sp. A4B17]